MKPTLHLPCLYFLQLFVNEEVNPSLGCKNRSQWCTRRNYDARQPRVSTIVASDVIRTAARVYGPYSSEEVNRNELFKLFAVNTRHYYANDLSSIFQTRKGISRTGRVRVDLWYRKLCGITKIESLKPK